MHNVRYETLAFLLDIVNHSREEDSNTIIARAFIENRSELASLTLDQIAERYPVSQATITRFIKKLGFTDYNEFRSSMSVSNYFIENLANTNTPNTAQQIKGDVQQELAKTLAYLEQTDAETFVQLLHRMLPYHRIVFVGSKLSTSILYLLQLRFTAIGHDCYALSHSNFQEQMLSSLQEGDLVVAVSVEDRWLSRRNQELFRSSKAATMLWTTDSMHDYNDSFDEVFLFGDQPAHNIGYHYLMQGVMIMSEILVQMNSGFIK